LAVMAPIHAQRRRQERGPCRSEFRYGSLTRLVRLLARVDAKDVTARYDKGVLEVSVPVRETRPESSRVTIQTQAEPRHKHPRDGGNQPAGTGTPPGPAGQ
jgi:hypothetical protein